MNMSKANESIIGTFHHIIVLEHLLVFQQSARFYRVDSRTLVSILVRRLAGNVSFFKSTMMNFEVLWLTMT